MMTDSMKPEDEVKVGLTIAPLEHSPEETVECQLCNQNIYKHLLAKHWENCMYFVLAQASSLAVKYE